MMRRSLHLIFALLVLSPQGSAFAQNSVNAEACLADVNLWLAREHRFYRAVLIGQIKAEDAPLGAIRYSFEGDVWTKTESDAWKTYAPGYEATTWTDFQMEEMAEFPPRRGYVEMRKALTSELIPPLLQNLRALRCRIRAVCELMEASQAENASDPITVHVDGCLDTTFPRIQSCGFGGQSLRFDQELVKDACPNTIDALFQRETTMLRTLVAYDASYRTLLQLSGIMEKFIYDFQFSLISPLWDTTRVLLELDRIPCFISQCDE